MDHIENKMCDYAESFNMLVDTQSAHEDEIAWLKSKVEDLEDRSHHNNLKIWGVLESIQQSQLRQFTGDLLLVIIPTLTVEDLTID